MGPLMACYFCSRQESAGPRMRIPKPRNRVGSCWVGDLIDSKMGQQKYDLSLGWRADIPSQLNSGSLKNIHTKRSFDGSTKQGIVVFKGRAPRADRNGRGEDGQTLALQRQTHSARCRQGPQVDRQEFLGPGNSGGADRQRSREGPQPGLREPRQGREHKRKSWGGGGGNVVEKQPHHGYRLHGCFVWYVSECECECECDRVYFGKG